MPGTVQIKHCEPCFLSLCIRAVYVIALYKSTFTYLLSFWVTVDTEASMTAYSQHWGPATKARPIAHALMYALVLCNEWCATLPCREGWCVVCNWGSCTVYLVSSTAVSEVSLAVRLICPTSDRYTERPSSAHQPTFPARSVQRWPRCSV